MVTSPSSREHVMWYVDSDCSRCMTGDPSILSNFVLHDGKIVNLEIIARPKLLKRDVLEYLLLLKMFILVDGLKHNL